MKKGVVLSAVILTVSLLITALKRHVPPMTDCKRRIVKRDIQMSKSANCWFSKSPTTNTLTAVVFTTTTAAAISCLMMKRF